MLHSPKPPQFSIVPSSQIPNSCTHSIQVKPSLPHLPNFFCIYVARFLKINRRIVDFSSPFLLLFPLLRYGRWNPFHDFCHFSHRYQRKKIKVPAIFASAQPWQTQISQRLSLSCSILKFFHVTLAEPWAVEPEGKYQRWSADTVTVCLSANSLNFCHRKPL